MLLIDEHGIRQRANFFRSLKRLFRQIGFGVDVTQWIDPWAGVFGAAGILRYGNDFKILIF